MHNLKKFEKDLVRRTVISMDVIFMRVTYFAYFEIRLKSIKFDEKMKNIKSQTIFITTSIIRQFQYFVLFSF